MSPGQALKTTDVPVQKGNVDTEKGDDDTKGHTEDGSLRIKGSGLWENLSSQPSEETKPL